MTVKSINPLTEEVIGEYPLWTDAETEKALATAARSFSSWRKLSLEERLRPLRQLAKVLRIHHGEWAGLITDEMGKTLRESDAEIEKCAATCEFLAEYLPDWLAPEQVEAPKGRWEVLCEPMGVVVGIMPWNFPFWQVLRCALPALSVGNAVLMKHASNVFGCSVTIQRALQEAGYPDGIYQHAALSSTQVLRVIPDARVRGVSLTGSTAAGRSVGEVAGKSLKKCVLELGGSDAYVILDDAPLETAAESCVASRLTNGGQSCVSAKRFIVTEKNTKAFAKLFIEKMRAKKFGDPRAADVQIGPLARIDLRDQLHKQVEAAVKGGAKLELGGEIPKREGAFYPPSVLTNVDDKNTAFKEELFGPVAAIITARDEDHAIELANESAYGLGSAVYSANIDKALNVARHRLEAGMSFVNDFVRSDARIPFGGVKDSGVGRELGRHGVKEFANVKSVVVL